MDNTHKEDPSFLVLLLFLSYFLQPTQFCALPGWDPEAAGGLFGPWPPSPRALAVVFGLAQVASKPLFDTSFPSNTLF